MKAIMESWREFLKVNVDVEGWGSIPPFSGKALQVLIDGQRLIVVVTTSQYGPTAFYQSTGTGSNITTKDIKDRKYKNK